MDIETLKKIEAIQKDLSYPIFDNSEEALQKRLELEKLLHEEQDILDNNTESIVF